MDIEKAIEILNDTEADMIYTQREIDATYHIAIQALEKQIPQKTKKNKYGVNFCSNCNNSVWQNRDESNYCFRCGQGLNWG